MMSYESYDLLSILRRIRKNLSSTASGVTVISVQDASNTSRVNLSSAIVDLNHVLRRRSIVNVSWTVPLMQWSSAKWSVL